MSAEGIRGGQRQPDVMAGMALPSRACWGRARGSQPNYPHVRKELHSFEKVMQHTISTGSPLDLCLSHPTQSKQHAYAFKGRFFGSWATYFPKTPPLPSELSTFELVPDAIEINDQIVVPLGSFWIRPPCFVRPM